MPRRENRVWGLKHFSVFRVLVIDSSMCVFLWLTNENMFYSRPMVVLKPLSLVAGFSNVVVSSRTRAWSPYSLFTNVRALFLRADFTRPENENLFYFLLTRSSREDSGSDTDTRIIRVRERQLIVRCELGSSQPASSSMWHSDSLCFRFGKAVADGSVEETKDELAMAHTETCNYTVTTGSPQT